MSKKLNGLKSRVATELKVNRTVCPATAKELVGLCETLEHSNLTVLERSQLLDIAVNNYMREPTQANKEAVERCRCELRTAIGDSL